MVGVWEEGLGFVMLTERRVRKGSEWKYRFGN